jgi:Rrf2 family protein
MFRLSRRADYAVRMLLTLAAAPPGATLPAAELSAQTAVPVSLAHKITQDLARAGLVRSTPGPAGGAELARPAEAISLLDILEAMEGPLCLNLCLMGPGTCPRDGTCPAHTAWAHIQNVLRQELAAQSLARLAAQSIQYTVSAIPAPIPVSGD